MASKARVAARQAAAMESQDERLAALEKELKVVKSIVSKILKAIESLNEATEGDKK